MTSVVTVSRPPVPAEVFELFPGRWVAIRDGEVVADAGSRNELDSDSRVEPADARFKVPEPGAKFF
jgi:hypothetical protein